MERTKQILVWISLFHSMQVIAQHIDPHLDSTAVWQQQENLTSSRSKIIEQWQKESQSAIEQNTRAHPMMTMIQPLTQDDAIINQKVKQTVATLNPHLRTKTHNGVVTLQGIAQDREQKEHIITLVQTVIGVKMVIDQLSLRQEKTFAMQPKQSDVDITNQIKVKLAHNPHYAFIHVDTRAGNVRLTGQVTQPHLIEQIEKIIAVIPDVQQIDNQLTIEHSNRE